MKMNKGFALLLLIAWAEGSFGLRPAANVKPHIIMHLADDFGYEKSCSRWRVIDNKYPGPHSLSRCSLCVFLDVVLHTIKQLGQRRMAQA